MREGFIVTTFSMESLLFIKELSDKDLRAAKASEAIHFVLLVMSFTDWDLMLPSTFAINDNYEIVDAGDSKFLDC